MIYLKKIKYGNDKKIQTKSLEAEFRTYVLIRNIGGRGNQLIIDNLTSKKVELKK